MATSKLSMVVDVDMSQLNEALEKARELMQLEERQALNNMALGVSAAGFIAAGSQRKVSRRGLFGLGWLRRRA